MSSKEKMNHKNKIIRRYYLAAEVYLQSPLALSSGENEVSDMDVLKNGKGEVFIPGTSVAGAFRSYLNQKKNKEGLFGFSDGDQGRMSRVTVSDIYFEDPDRQPKISIRDGVQLDDNKNVSNKFDMEILETGAKGMLKISCVVRKEDEDFELDHTIKKLFKGIASGEIRFGGNKNRGFGRLRVGTVWEKDFQPDDLNEWLAFCKSGQNVVKIVPGQEARSWMADMKIEDAQYVKCVIPLRLTGGISIRKYSTRPDKADFEHITCNGEPIIPGTSWNGAIRSDVRNILFQAGCSNELVNDLTDTWFGYVRVGKQKEAENQSSAEQSLVVIGESVLKDSVPLPVTRNRINRFDSSTIESALYSEIMYCGGTTDLEIMVKKDSRRYYEALVAALELVIKDISKGYLAVGGQVSIGRGIFEAAEDMPASITADQELLEAGRSLLYELVRKGA